MTWMKWNRQVSWALWTSDEVYGWSTYQTGSSWQRTDRRDIWTSSETRMLCLLTCPSKVSFRAAVSCLGG